VSPSESFQLPLLVLGYRFSPRSLKTYTFVRQSKFQADGAGLLRSRLLPIVVLLPSSSSSWSSSSLPSSSSSRLSFSLPFFHCRSSSSDCRSSLPFSPIAVPLPNWRPPAPRTSSCRIDQQPPHRPLASTLQSSSTRSIWLGFLPLIAPVQPDLF